MKNTTLEDKGRRDLDFRTSKVVEILPEFYGGDYPKLVSMLETYLKFMDSEGGINYDLRNLFRARDIESVSLEFLEFLMDETAGGMSVDQFTDPRFIAQNFPDFFRYKGSLLSAKMFFRAFYGEEVEISYPKDDLIVVGESRIGPDYLKVIQNGQLYQTLSILVKSSRSSSQWKELYKQLVHPAGFYLGAEVLVEGVVDLDLDSMPNALPDSDANLVTTSSTATFSLTAVSEPMTVLITSPDSSTEYRVNLLKKVDLYDSVTIETMGDQYATSFRISDANHPNFSDSSTGSIVDFSNTIETFDHSVFDISRDSIAPAASTWILQDGEWNDSGVWVDADTWNDGTTWILEPGYWLDSGTWIDSSSWNG